MLYKSRQTRPQTKEYSLFCGPDGYSFYQCRGSNVPRVGTGRIYNVQSEINKPCPCDSCNRQEVRKYWRFYVQTAQHVVYNTEEAKKTRIDLFYDDERSHLDGKVVSVPALRVGLSDAQYDLCYMECVTHDERIGEMVESLHRRWLSLDEAIRSAPIYFNESSLSYLPRKTEATRSRPKSTPIYFKKSSLSDRPREMFIRERQNYTLIISHPHGQAKKITLGKERDEAGEKGVILYREYQTATFPGSSGAQAFVLYTDVDDADVRHWAICHNLFAFYSFIHSGTQTSSVSTDQINFGHFYVFY